MTSYTSSTPRHNSHHRLPVELWAMSWEALSLRDRLCVTQVCHAWRTLALSSPRIWANIDLVVGGNVEESSSVSTLTSTASDCCAGLASILTRSGQLQLHVAVRFNSTAGTQLNFEETSNIDYMSSKILGMLRPESHRLAHLYIQVVRAQLAPYVLWVLSPLPVLQDLQCDVARGEDDGSNRTYPMPFYHWTSKLLDAPRLQRLAVDGEVYHWLARHATSPSSPSVPTTMKQPPAALNIPNLTSIRMGIKSLNDLFDIFIACPRLASTHFAMQQSSWYFMETRRPFGPTEQALLAEHSQHLESLRIVNIPPDLEKGAAMYKDEWDLLWILVDGPRCFNVELHYSTGVALHAASPGTTSLARDGGRRPEAPASPFIGLEVFRDLTCSKFKINFGEHTLVITADGVDADGRARRRVLSFKHTRQLREQVITNKPRGLWSVIRPTDVVSLQLCGTMHRSAQPGDSATGSSSVQQFAATDFNLEGECDWPQSMRVMVLAG